MRIGVNCISPASIPVVSQLFKEQQIDFCELMVDNFIHCDAQQIREAFTDIPLSLHIVASRFTEKNLTELTMLGTHLRAWINEITPLYVSDHITRFSDNAGKRLPLIQEFDYAVHYDVLMERISLWQSLLGVPLFLENNASLTIAGKWQVDFYKCLLQNPSIGLLYDISNAYIAERNHVCSREHWLPLISEAKHFHIAGFSYFENELAIDTHDQPLADPVIQSMLTHCQSNLKNSERTLVIEVDTTLQYESIMMEIAKVRAVAG